MASTVVIVCPECGKQINAPENILGKKVRCKSCQAAFVARASSGKSPSNKTAKPAQSATPKPVPAASKADEEEDDQNPYGLIDADLSKRCPECANEMEEEDVICLTCGYNTMTRERHKTIKTYDNTVTDQVSWLLPGIICVLVIIATIIFDIWYLMHIDDLLGNEDSWYKSMWAHGGIKLWVVIISLFIIFFTGRFAVKRLILNYARPEVEKSK
jgi:DNA-directed RNA polymerase subunit RPC12/RpoP